MCMGIGITCLRYWRKKYKVVIFRVYKTTVAYFLKVVVELKNIVRFIYGLRKL